MTVNIVLLGPPGAGKGTQAEMLAAKYDWPQVATGDILRSAVSDGTPFGLEAKKYMDAGELVPDGVVEGIAAERLSDEDCRDGFILDGFPRNLHQAVALESRLLEDGRRIEMILNMKVDTEVLVERLTGRRVCSKCGANYHMLFNTPAVEGSCDSCGGELYQRDDDNEKTVRRRLEVYRAQTEPLIEHYGKNGTLVSVDGSQSPDEVFREICGAIDSAG